MRGRTTILFVLLALLCAVLFVVDVAVGSISIPFSDVVNVLLGKGSAEMRSIVLDIRLVRALTAILAGAALSVSGLQMQVLFRNPLAGP
ncbi:MAG: iron chelate uptake ABC transporter family permease subunit, partial [Alistipes sp.]|nr:iron chelate uptake ABC transporter family permease subunit [Alistipes sp.]